VDGIDTRLNDLGNQVGGFGNTMAAMGSEIAGLRGQVNDVANYAVATRREAREGVAAAMAMSSAAMPSAGGRTSWTANTALFRGEVGAGFSVAHRLNTAVPVAVTFGYRNGGGRSHGVRAGLMGEF
jgi:autotransporter adhesin